jgi:hypothetical protein
LVSTVVMLLVLSFAVWFKEDETSDGTLLPTDTPGTVGCVGTGRDCDSPPSALPPPQTDDAVLTHLRIYTTIRFQDIDIEQFAVASFDIAFRGDLEHAILNPTRNVTYGALEVSVEVGCFLGACSSESWCSSRRAGKRTLSKRCWSTIVRVCSTIRR